MRKILASLLLAFFVGAASAQEINIIPRPAEIKMGKGFFTITTETAIAYDQFSESAAFFLNEYLNKVYGFKLRTTMHNRENKKAIYLMYGNDKEKKGSYIFDCTKNSIIIGGSSEGMFYGIQSLIQLLPIQNQKSKTQNIQLSIPQLSITDYPRFAYRGMHLDVSRHFFPVDFIKKYIDYLALHKFNTFHWHLTDDQGWRIEIKKYPKLTEVGAWRNGTIIGRYPGNDNDAIKYGGFYTQKQIKEIVKYAADRYITVVPEIEMPGHASAAIAAYPELSCFPNEPTKIPNEWISTASKNAKTKLVQETWGVFEDVFAPTETTFSFLQNVLDEVMPLFPSKYIHIGGDECPKESWKRSDFCQNLIKEKGLKDEHELQSYFIQRMEKYVNSKGKNIIGWDEILEGGLAPNATVMSWRGEKGGIEAAKQKHNVIMTPGSHCYFDHSQSKNEDSVTIGGYLPIEKVYAYNPVPKELNAEQAKFILGAQANLWTEYIRHQSKVEYMIFPRMLALSEVLWSDTTGRNWDEFEPRLMREMEKLRNKKIIVSDALFDIKTEILPSDKIGDLKIQFSSKVKNVQFGIRIDYCKKIQCEGRTIYKDSLVSNSFILNKDLEFSPFTLNEKLFSWRPLNIHFNKATAQKITLTIPPSNSYPGNGGAFGLVNGVVSDKGINSAEWLGFAEGQDAEMVIDMGSTQEINEVKVHTLDQQGSWIYLPESMEVATSNDGVNFAKVTSTTKIIDDQLRMKYVVNSFDKTNCRFVKIWVKNFGQIPSGKPGAGHQAWLFLDEVQIASPNPSKGGE
jgi:hexosaminidase